MEKSSQIYFKDREEVKYLGFVAWEDDKGKQSWVLAGIYLKRTFQKSSWIFQGMHGHIMSFQDQERQMDHNKLWKIWKRWEYQTTWPASWETCMQVRKQQLELNMEQQTGSK